MKSARVATWNLERKRPTSAKGAEALDYVFGLDAEIIVLTETRATTPTFDGHFAFSEPLTAKRFAPDERKVGVWSKNPLELVAFDSPIDQRRFVAGRTETKIGQVLVLGVCIPWHMAEATKWASPQRKVWEMHREFLAHLGEIMSRLDEPFIVAGDFNQRIPRRKGGNKLAAELMAETFAELEIVTIGTLPRCENPGIDHIAISKQLSPLRVQGWPKNVTGTVVTDHDGAFADLAGA